MPPRAAPTHPLAGAYEKAPSTAARAAL
jgi:hypothetical protein